MGTMGTAMDFGALVPEAALLAGAILVLLLGSFLPRQWQRVATAIAGGTAITSAAVAALGAASAGRIVFTGSYALDAGTSAIRIAAPLATVVVLILGRRESRDHPRESEIAALLLLATLGTVVLAGADDLLLIGTGFLLASIPLYALIGLAGSRAGSEAALKTYLMGAILGVTMFLGIAVLAGLGGGTTYADLARRLPDAPAAGVAVGFVAVLAGLLFKAGAVPGHFWVPDAAQGSGIAVAAFVTTVPKLGAFIAIARLVAVVQPSVAAGTLVAAIAALTLALGTLAALWQRNARRLLGWSTVSQAGFVLLPAAAIGTVPAALGPLVVYLVFYAVTNLALFAVVAALPDRPDLPDWWGTGRRHPWLVAVLVVGLLSLVGTPPTLVFVGKVAVFTAAVDGGFAWLVVVAIAASVASLVYALRWIGAALRRDDAALRDQPIRSSAVTALVLGVLTLAAGAAALPLLAAGLRLVG